MSMVHPAIQSAWKSTLREGRQPLLESVIDEISGTSEAIHIAIGADDGSLINDAVQVEETHIDALPPRFGCSRLASTVATENQPSIRSAINAKPSGSQVVGSNQRDFEEPKCPTFVSSVKEELNLEYAILLRHTCTKVFSNHSDIMKYAYSRLDEGKFYGIIAHAI